MENNSVKNNLSREDIISDIKLCLGADICREKVYLLVEGEDDINFLHSFLLENVYIYESYDGKHGVEVIVSEIFSSNERVIGIRDRDYQLKPVSSKIFYYDYGCMEMMIIHNDEVFNNLYAEYYKGNDSYLQLREIILKELKYISIIRMYNERNNWRKILKGISISKAWNKKLKKFDNMEIVNQINQINNNFFDKSIIEQIDLEYTREWDMNDFFSYTQGHDFFMLYATICNQFRKKSVKHTQIEASGRCIFRWSDFVKTNLYKKLKDYEQLQRISIIPSA